MTHFFFAFQEYIIAWAIYIVSISDQRRIYELEEREELKRQKREIQKLDTATKIMKSKHKEKWREVWSEFQSEELRRMEHLEFIHEQQREQLREQLDKRRNQTSRFHFSTQLREMQREEKALLKLHYYSEAARLRSVINAREKQERKEQESKCIAYEQSRWNRLAITQESEKKSLLDKLKNMREKRKHEQENDNAVIEQRFKNMLNNMSHSHRMEFIVKREVGPTANLSRRSHKTHASTYAGTLALERAASERYRVPSLCQMYDI